MALEFKLSYTANDINNRLGKIDSLAEKRELPTKTSELINDSGFVNETYVQEYAQPVGDYTLKSEILGFATEEYVNNKIAEIGGGTGGGSGSAEGAVLYTAQTLTDAQKTQARTNIGAAAIGSGGGSGISVQSDMNQNDSNAPDYIKNRTHWAEPPVTTTEVILPETTIEFSNGYAELSSLLFLDNGDEYTVTLDGVEYSVVAEEASLMGMNFIVFGNPAILALDETAQDNGQPFAGAYSTSEAVLMFMTTDIETTAHTVSITKVTTTQKVYKLDDKYINADWTAQKTAISTDGVVETTGIVTVDGFVIPSESCNINALLVAEYVDVVWNGEIYRYLPKTIEVAGLTLFGNMSIFEPTCPDSGEPFIFFIYSNMNLVAVVPLMETQATFSITCYNTVPVSTIPEEFLPEKLQFGNEYEAEVYKDAITWDGDITGREDLISCYYVSNAVPTIEEVMNGGIITANTGESITFTSDDIDVGDAIQIRNIIVILPKNNVYGYRSGIYFFRNNSQYISELKINNYAFVETTTKIKTIDPMYLPEDIGGGVTSYNDLTDKPIPDASATTEGAFLRVVNGAWKAVVLPNAEDGEF